MKIIDRLNEDGIHISFEVFPPKTDEGYDKVIGAVDEIATSGSGFHQCDIRGGRRHKQEHCQDRIAHQRRSECIEPRSFDMCLFHKRRGQKGDRKSEGTRDRQYPRTARGYSARNGFPGCGPVQICIRAGGGDTENTVISALVPPAIRRGMWRTSISPMISVI